jgi:HK97 family phage portal protein
MRLWDRISKRAIDASAFLTSDDDLYGAPSYTGKRVTKETALRLIAVYACSGIISDAIASMPIDVVEKGDSERRRLTPPAWLDPEFWPNPESSLYNFVFRYVVSVLLGGTGFGLITARDRLGFPMEVWNVKAPYRSTRQNGYLQYVFEDGTLVTPHTPRNPSGDLVVVKGFDGGGDYGLDPIMNVAKQAVGLGLATEEFGGRFFGQGQQPSGVIEANGSVNDADLKIMATTWTESQGGLKKAHLPAVLANARWRQLQVNNDSAQFIETRRFQINEIARLFRVPPHLISDVDRSTSWGTGIEEQNLAFIRWTLLPWINRLEHAFNAMLPRGQVVKFNTASLERADLTSRYQAYGVGRQWGFLSANDIRALEDLAPVPEGNIYLSPLNMVSAESPVASQGSAVGSSSIGGQT